MIPERFRQPPPRAIGGPRAPTGLTESDMGLLAAWATHSHEEIHRYLRQRQTVLQIVAVAATAALATAAQNTDLAVPLVIAAPFVLCIAVVNWMNCGAEVAISAAVVEEIEETLRGERGRWLLLKETAVNQRKPNRIGGALGNVGPMLFVAAAVVASPVVAFAESRWYVGVADVLLLVLFVGGILVNWRRVASIRGGMHDEIEKIKRLDHAAPGGNP